MKFRELRPAFAMVFSLALTGCIFLVDSLPDGTSTTCQLTTPQFSSGTTVCKTCITDNCQKTLDVCCGDSTCQAQLNNVDSCANEEGCTSLAQAGGTEGATSDLIACIASECGGECSGIDAAPAKDGSTTCTSCGPTCTVSSDATECSCAVLPTNGTSVNCPSSKFAGASVCCASKNYPSVASGSCACQALTCDDSGDGVCSCQLGSFGAGNTTSCFPSGSASSCCMSADRSSCSCDPSNDCSGAGEMTVDYCSTTQWSCPADGMRTVLVNNCSD